MSASDKEGKTQYFVSGIHIARRGRDNRCLLECFLPAKKDVPQRVY